MASPSVTYTLANGTTADATKLNQNFSDIIAGMTDGSKSFSIDALTVAGAFVANGAVTLGNATSDDVTITGYLASALIPKTDAAYDLGGASNYWRNLFIKGTTLLQGAVTVNDAGSDVDFRIEGDTDANLFFCDASTDRIGIGTNAPNYKMVLAVASADKVLLSCGSVADSQTVAFKAYGVANSKGRYAEIVCARTTPDAEDYIAGALILQSDNGTLGHVWSDNSAILCISTDFNVIGRAAGAAGVTVVGTQTSDIRLKTDIEPCKYGLAEVLKMEPISFKLYGQHKIGFSAQQMETIVAEAVGSSGTKLDNGEYAKSMEYVQLIAVLVNAIKEQQNQIEQIKGKIL